MTEPGGEQKELFDEVDRVQKRYLRKLHRRHVLTHHGLPAGICGLMFGVLGHMIGHGISTKDWNEVIAASLAAVMLSAIYWLTVFRR